MEFLYIISNESMPGMIKVGRTSTSVEQRMGELNTTGIPTKFEIEVVFSVSNSKEAEKKAHTSLKRYRVSKQREFFKVPVTTAIKKLIQDVDSLAVHKAREGLNVKNIIDFHEKKKRKEAEVAIEQRAVEARKRNSKINSLLLAQKSLEVEYRKLGPKRYETGEWWSILFVPFEIILLGEKFFYLCFVVGVISIFQGQVGGFLFGFICLALALIPRVVLDTYRNRCNDKQRKAHQEHNILESKISDASYQLKKLGYKI